MPSSPAGGQQRRQGINHQFLCRCHDRSVHDLGTERRAAKKKLRANRVRRERRVSIRSADAVPRGNGCYCEDQNAILFAGGTTPQKARQQLGASERENDERETTARSRGVSGPGKARKTSSLGGSPKGITQLQSQTQPERQEVRPVARGQRPAKNRRRPCVQGIDAKKHLQAH